MKRYGLIGYPLGHSFSRDYFMDKFRKEGIDAVYDNFPLKDLTDFRKMPERYPGLEGLNITIPYKSRVIDLLDDVEGRAAETGAVNVVKITEKGGCWFFKGYNSDIDGFVLSLLPLLGESRGKALVLGTGGASLAVRAGLEEIGMEYSVVSRHSEKAAYSYSDITDDILKAYRLIVNASPVGMYPSDNEAPDLPYHALDSNHILYDLVYNPVETLFLKKGKERGCITKNGLEMLYIQADKAWEIWNA
ncbi:MAG: shikimate dehydrogenase [Bacteroidales bacterium]|nr:shikimate dehydrogenase [Bacteroidales bacterium]